MSRKNKAANTTTPPSNPAATQADEYGLMDGAEDAGIDLEAFLAKQGDSAKKADAEAVPAVDAGLATDLAAQLAAAEQKASEHYDAWLRSQAEMENVRRRAQEDISKTHKFAVEKFAGELLAVKDSLEAALAVQEQSLEAIKAGVELTLKQLGAAFERSAISEVNPLGEKFDPHQHQAIGMVASDQAANTVVQVLQKGYLLADRVLRPAMVMIAKAPEQG